MLFRIIILAAAALAASPSSAAVECAGYFVGDWGGRGKVQFGGSTEVESSWSYRADGGYSSTTRFVQKDGAWSETRASEGRWTASSGDAPDVCIIRTESKGDGFSSDFSVDAQIVDANSHRIMGLLVKRRQAAR